MIYSDKNLSQKLERAEGASNARFVEARGRISSAEKFEWTEIGGAYAMFDGVDSPLTQTFGLGLFDEITITELTQIEDFFRKHDAPVCHEVSPLAAPSLLALLNQRGYQPIELTSVMFQSLENRQANSPINEKISTRIIRAGEENLWAQTAADGWATEMRELGDFMYEFGKVSATCENGFPFIAETESQPIAAGMLFRHADVAVLAGASTVPAGRRQGAQLALLEARLKFAAENGCKLAMMGAAPGSQSQKNAEKQGFRIAYTRIKWALRI